MRKKYQGFIIAVSLAATLVSCVDTRQATYFNDINDAVVVPSESDKVSPVIQKNDILSITISSLSAEASAIFNLSSTANSGNNVTNAPATRAIFAWLNNINMETIEVKQTLYEDDVWQKWSPL